jgi:hypothetical protein
VITIVEINYYRRTDFIYILNVPDVTSKFHTLVTFVNDDINNIYTTSLDMLVIYLQAKFHMPSYSGSLLLAIKPKAKWRLHAAAMLPFSIEKHYQNRRCTIVCLGSTWEMNSSLRARSHPPYTIIVDCENSCRVYPRFNGLIGGRGVRYCRMSVFLTNTCDGYSRF